MSVTTGINFWLCFKGTKVSVLKGGFNTFEQAQEYWRKRKDRWRMEIRNKDRKTVLYPVPSNLKEKNNVGKDS